MHGGQGKAGPVRVAVHVVRPDRVAALRLGTAQPRRHDPANVLRPHVEPAIARSAVERAALVRREEVALVLPPGLERAGAGVADDLASLRPQRLDRLLLLVFPPLMLLS